MQNNEWLPNYTQIAGSDVVSHASLHIIVSKMHVELRLLAIWVLKEEKF